MVRARPIRRLAARDLRQPDRAEAAARDAGVGAGLEHLGAGGAFRILQHAVLLHDQRPAQRDHHQDAQQRPQHGHQHHPRQFQIEAQDQDGRHGHPDAKGDGFARRAGRLHDVVLQNGGVALPPSFAQSRNSVSEMTATGMEALTVSPTLSTR